MVFGAAQQDCSPEQRQVSGSRTMAVQTAKRRLDRKARTAISIAVALLLAGPLFVIVKIVAAKLSGEPAQVFHPQDDQLVMLRDGSTMLVKKSSVGGKVAHWLKLDLKGQQTFPVGNANFAPRSAMLTHDGWQNVIQFSQMLRTHRNVKAVILFSPHHGDPATTELEHSRADRIRDEVLKEGVKADQVAVSREAFEAGHSASADEGLEVVLTNKA
jgi:hypothetical protein